MNETSPMPSLQLADPALASHVAIKNGNWSDPDVWSTQTIPGNGANVYIPENLSVIIQSELQERIETVRIDGRLEFANDVNTQLFIDTLVSSEVGHLVIGESDNPISDNVIAKIIFTGDEPIDRSSDPNLIGRGALLHGKTDIYGAEKTSFTSLAEFAEAGDRSLTLTEIPIGWRIGDSIVITGTDIDNVTSDEVAIVTSIDGSTIEIDAPLEWDHIPPREDLDVHVANLTRNIQITSENTDLLSRGHVMFIHTTDVNVHYAQLSNLGRSDKIIGLDDWTLVSEPEGSVGEVQISDDGGSNIRGRYSLHVHRTGPDGPAAVIKGNVVTDDPGWAYTNHSSNVDFIDNVSYNIGGAAYVTEAGDEVGSFTRNIAIRTVNPQFEPFLEDGEINTEQEPDARVARQDFGWQGDGFWLHGPNVSLEDNVVSGASSHGYVYWTLGLVESDVGEILVNVEHIINGDLIGEAGTMVRSKQVQIPSFENNQSYVVKDGLLVYYVHTDHRDDQDREFADDGSLADVPQQFEDQLVSNFNNFTAWAVTSTGVGAPYSSRLSFSNLDLIGDYREGSVGVALDHFATQHSMTLRDSEIRGFDIGVAAPRQGYGVVENLTLQNLVDIRISAPTIDPRDVTFRNLNFVSHELQTQNEINRIHYLFDPYRDANFDNGHLGVDFNNAVVDEFQENEISENGYYTPVYSPYLLPDRLTVIDDAEQVYGLYFLEQERNFIPIYADSELSNLLPDEISEKTNEELMSEFGLAWGGAIMPEDAQEVSFIEGGKIGSAIFSNNAFPPTLNEGTQLFDEYGRIPENRTLAASIITDVSETIVLSDLSETYSSTNLPETISAQDGDDVIIASEGDDQIDGGEGIDRVYYNGSQNNYTVTITPSYVQIFDRRDSGNGIDTLRNVEFIDFDIGVLNLLQFGGAIYLNGSEFTGFIELYIAYFNRAPDAIGLNFWGTAYANGMSLDEIGKQFATQSETIETYPEGISNTDFATAVYSNVLGRVPDQVGLDFWVGMLNAGEVTRDQFILEVLRGVQAGTDDRTYLDNKVKVGAYFSVHKGMSDVTNATTTMELYDGTESSIDRAFIAIDDHYQAALDSESGEFLLQVVGVLDNISEG